jgi:hypothetical protein
MQWVASLQLHLDVTFVKLCYYERNHYDLVPKHLLLPPGSGEIGCSLTGFPLSCDSANSCSLFESTAAKHQHVLEVCDLFFPYSRRSDHRPLHPKRTSTEWERYNTAPATDPSPLASSRRFVLLPVQADRSLSDSSCVESMPRKEETESRQESQGGSVMSSGLGFFHQC